MNQVNSEIENDTGPGVILLVEDAKLLGIVPFVPRETAHLLYLDILGLITEMAGRRHEMPLLAMIKHLSHLQ